MRGRHLVTLAPKSSDLSKELLNRAVTLVGGCKSLQQGVLKCLTGWLVEVAEMILYHLRSRKLADGKADRHLTRLTDDGDGPGVVLLPLGPCLKRG